MAAVHSRLVCVCWQVSLGETSQSYISPAALPVSLSYGSPYDSPISVPPCPFLSVVRQAVQSDCSSLLIPDRVDLEAFPCL